MKKVFSVAKFIDNCRAIGLDEIYIHFILLSNWQLRCHGLTSEEMAKVYIVSDDAWMVEVDDDKEETQ